MNKHEILRNPVLKKRYLFLSNSHCEQGPALQSRTLDGLNVRLEAGPAQFRTLNQWFPNAYWLGSIKSQIVMAFVGLIWFD